jgi:hypothetical protein
VVVASVAGSAGTRRSAVTLHLVIPQVILCVEDVGADGAFVLSLRLSFAERLVCPRPYRSFIVFGHRHFKIAAVASAAIPGGVKVNGHLRMAW